MKRTDMKKIKEIVRLSSLKSLSLREISLAVGVSRPVVTKISIAFEASQLTYDDIKKLNEDQIIDLLFNKSKNNDNNSRYLILSEKFEYFEKELKKPFVTRQKLWEEYIKENPDGYSRSQFCDLFNSWRKSYQLTMHIEHKAGEKMFVDFAGKKLYITDKISGEKRAVEVFIAILPASQYTFVCAVDSQKTTDWIKGSEEALWYFGGTPKAITPDCYKSAVKKFNRYDPEINPEYSLFGEHYNLAIVPARPAHPKDKALVENAVKIVYSRIYASVRNDIFYSIQELNKAIFDELAKYNSRKMQKTKLSRVELFNSIEKNHMGQLPIELYEPKKYTKSRIQSNYHILLTEDNKYYSVPYRYFAGNNNIKVDVYYTNNAVEIYLKNERIAVHKRDYSEKTYITEISHLPENHKAFLERLNPEKTIMQAKSKGPFISNMIDLIISKHKIPEQSYDTAKGFIKLCNTYGIERVENACQKAIYLGFLSYRAVLDLLKNNLEKMDENNYLEHEIIPQNDDVRGKKYFSNKLKEKNRG